MISHTPPDLYSLARRLIAEGWPPIAAYSEACDRIDLWWRLRGQSEGSPEGETVNEGAQ